MIVVYYNSFTLYMLVVVHGWNPLDHKRSVETVHVVAGRVESKQSDCSILINSHSSLIMLRMAGLHLDHTNIEMLILLYGGKLVAGRVEGPKHTIVK